MFARVGWDPRPARPTTKLLRGNIRHPGGARRCGRGGGGAEALRGLSGQSRKPDRGDPQIGARDRRQPCRRGDLGAAAPAASRTSPTDGRGCTACWAPATAPLWPQGLALALTPSPRPPISRGSSRRLRGLSGAGLRLRPGPPGAHRRPAGTQQPLELLRRMAKSRATS